MIMWPTDSPLQKLVNNAALDSGDPYDLPMKQTLLNGAKSNCMGFQR
jgi:hypothetical protein